MYTEEKNAMNTHGIRFEKMLKFDQDLNFKGFPHEIESM